MQHNMRDVRMELGLSLNELSQRSGVSAVHLGRIERGESDPTLTTMLKIAWGLRREVWEVFGTKKCK